MFALLGIHYRSKLNNWTKACVALVPVLLMLILALADVKVDFLNLLLPFVYTYLVLDPKEREVYEVVPYAILLFPIDINLKIIGFGACSLFNFSDFKFRSLPILKIAIISFLVLVDKNAGFKYILTFYLFLSLLETSNDDFAIVDGVILSYLVMSNIQHISETLNYSLILLCFMLLTFLLNKKNIFKTVFLFSSIVCILLNLEVHLMALILFFYSCKSLNLLVSLVAKESEVVKAFVNIGPFRNIFLLGLFVLCFSLKAPLLIGLSLVLALLILTLESEELIESVKVIKWYEVLYTIAFHTLLVSGVIYLVTSIFAIDQFYIPYAIGVFVTMALLQLLLSFKFGGYLKQFITWFDLGNFKRLLYLNNSFKQSLPVPVGTIVNKRSFELALSYRSARTISLVIMAMYFLGLIFQVVK